ncbi:unnamed protein product [Trifolium pratense]|uniref:Uncharacterized protein n=1 Tax=Trifolium pratense TaxID=57577 RepID=A0ACB0JVI4_TRIPR|nr:unnamed protein product [Trifolium pratense]
MSESSQTTKSGRSTRSKAKIESSQIIKDAVPVTIIQPNNLKPVAAAEKKGKKRTAEKKKEIVKVSDAISPSGNKSSKGSSKKKRRDYKSRIPLNMSDLVFESNVNTSEKATEVEPQNPKPVSEVVETIISTAGNPSQENLGSDAEKRDLNSMPVETEMEDTTTEVETETADKSPTITEMVAEKSTPVVTEEVVMPDVETSLNEHEEVETAEEEPVKETAAEKDVETTVTTSESSDEENGTAQEDTSADEEDTQTEESNQSLPTNEKEIEADKTVEAEKEKAKDVVDVDDYETTKTAERPTGGITKRLRSCTGKAVPTASKTPAPRVKTKGVGPVKGWSKVFSPPSKKKETLKRKKESSSDSDYDAAEDVANISSPNPKKSTAKKAPQGVEEAPCDNISFHRAAFALRWDYIYQRRLAVERELTKDALKCQDIFDYIKEAGLLKTVCDFSPCYELLVKEFLVNIPEECDNPLSKDYHKVFVRGKCINFSPVVINNYLGRSVEPKAELEVANDVVSSEITAGKVKVWPKKKLIPTSKLNVKYAILNRIGSTNWVPTKHATNVATNLGRFIYAVGTKVDYDYGTFIFDQTIKHIRSTAVKMPIVFPSLLCGIILDQYPDIKVVTNTPKKRESGFTFHHKLFGNHHVADHVGTSAAGAGVMTKKEIIAGLKVQCQDIDKQQAELEDRKKIFLKMIEGLEADEVPVKASANVAATGDQNNADEDEGYDTATDEDEDSDSSDDE